MSDGLAVRGPLDPAAVSDADLPELCLRMHAILNTMERPRCEGRHLPLDLFSQIDILASLVTHGPAPRWTDWAPVVSEFGEYYGLEGTAPIQIHPDDWRWAVEWIGGQA